MKPGYTVILCLTSFLVIFSCAGTGKSSSASATPGNSAASGEALLDSVSPGSAMIFKSDYFSTAQGAQDFIISRKDFHLIVDIMMTNTTSTPIRVINRTDTVQAGSDIKLSLDLGNTGIDRMVEPGETLTVSTNLRHENPNGLLSGLEKAGGDLSRGMWYVPKFNFEINGEKKSYTPRMFLIEIEE